MERNKINNYLNVSSIISLVGMNLTFLEIFWCLFFISDCANINGIWVGEGLLEHSCPWRAEASGLLKAGVTAGCESPDTSTGTWTQVICPTVWAFNCWTVSLASTRKKISPLKSYFFLMVPFYFPGFCHYSRLYSYIYRFRARNRKWESIWHLSLQVGVMSLSIVGS